MSAEVPQGPVVVEVHPHGFIFDLKFLTELLAPHILYPEQFGVGVVVVDRRLRISHPTQWDDSPGLISPTNTPPCYRDPSPVRPSPRALDNLAKAYWEKQWQIYGRLLQDYLQAYFRRPVSVDMNGWTIQVQGAMEPATLYAPPAGEVAA